MSGTVGYDVAFRCALAAAGLTDLTPGDVAFLRRAYQHLQQPLQAPIGLSPATTEPACLARLFAEQR
jgi:hypothetical protein